MELWVHRGDGRHGPYDLATFEGYLKEGRIVPADLVSYDGVGSPITVLELQRQQKLEEKIARARAALEMRSGESVSWFYRAHEGADLQSMTREELERRLAEGELSKKGWIWTPGLSHWAMASNGGFLFGHFDQGASPPPLPPVDSGEDPLDRLVRTLTDPLKRWRRLGAAWYFSAIQFFPGVASVLNRGWRLELISRAEGDPLPGPEGIPQYLKNGLILWAMFFMYLLPETLFLLVDGFSWIFDLLQLLQYTLGVITTSNPASGLGGLLGDAGIGFLLRSGFLIFYPIASWPFYRTAMLRFAVHRKLAVFFQFRKNFRVVRRGYPLIMNTYVLNKILWLLAVPLGTLVSLTGIGALLVPGFISPYRILLSGLLYRDLLGKLAGLEPEAFGLPAKRSAGELGELEESDDLHSSQWPWVISPNYAETKRVSGEVFLQAITADLKESPKTPRCFAAWIPGMWRWENALETLSFLERLAVSTPPEDLPEDIPGLSLTEQIRRFPRKFAKTFHPRQILEDLKNLILGNKVRDLEGRERRAPWALWKGKASWFVLGQYIPVIASIINKGWRLDLIRSGAVKGLPSRKNIGRHLAEGILLWGAYLMYLSPQFVLLAATDFVWVEKVISLAWWFLVSLIGGEPAMTLGNILGGGLLEFLLESIVMLAYPVACWPLYRGAMLRYALRGNFGVFFELRENWRFAKANFEELAMAYFWQKTLWAVYVLLSMILLATGIGVLLIPVLSPLRLVTSGVVYLRIMTKGQALRGFFPSSLPDNSMEAP